MNAQFYSNIKIKKITVGLILLIIIFPIVKDYVVSLGHNFYISHTVNRTLRDADIDSRMSIFALGRTVELKTIDDYIPPGKVVPMTVSSFISNLSPIQSYRLKKLCDDLSDKKLSCINNENCYANNTHLKSALLELPPLIKKNISKEYIIQNNKIKTKFIHLVVYDNYKRIYVEYYYIPF